MIMTILEAHGATEKWAVLEQAYNSGTGSLPPQIQQTSRAELSRSNLMADHHRMA